MKLFICALLIVFTSNTFAADEILQESQYSSVKQAIGKGKPFFVEVGSDSCYSCKVMGKLLYKVKQTNPTYNIHFVNVAKQRNAAYELKIRMIPTQIIYDASGKEVYRHIGMLRENELASLFEAFNFQ